MLLRVLHLLDVEVQLDIAQLDAAGVLRLIPRHDDLDLERWWYLGQRRWVLLELGHICCVLLPHFDLLVLDHILVLLRKVSLLFWPKTCFILDGLRDPGCQVLGQL